MHGNVENVGGTVQRIFLSHSSGDKVYAHAIAQKLESWGYGAFVDFDSDTWLSDVQGLGPLARKGLFSPSFMRWVP